MGSVEDLMRSFDGGETVWHDEYGGLTKDEVELLSDVALNSPEAQVYRLQERRLAFTRWLLENGRISEWL